jgi:hypothetical protein
MWRVLSLYCFARLAEKLQDRLLFFSRHFEEVCDMAPWNYDNVPGT